MQRNFNADSLREIPIMEVFRLLGEIPFRQSGKVVTFKGSDGLRAYPDTNTYHCFTGKRGTGDVIALVENYLNIDFIGACTWLADSFNLWEYGTGSGTENRIKPVLRRCTRPAIETDNQESVYYPPEILKGTFKAYEGNSFIQACRNVIPDVSPEDLERVISLYQIGTVQSAKSPVWNGACTFPAIDSGGNVHTIQVKPFKPDLHSEKWDNGNQKVTFIHSILQKHCEREKKPVPAWLSAYQERGAKLRYCLFGEHLLKQYPDNVIGIVEAPKTAIIGTLYEGFPDNPDNILWLAVWAKGYLQNLLPSLKGRKVVLFPDTSPDNATYYEWKAIAANFKNVSVSDVLCGIASNEDAADYWLKTPIAVYRNGGAEPDAVPVPEAVPIPEARGEYAPEFALLFKSLQPSYDKAQTMKEYAVRLFEGGYINNISDSAKVTSLINEAIQRGFISETVWQYRRADNPIKQAEPVPIPEPETLQELSTNRNRFLIRGKVCETENEAILAYFGANYPLPDEICEPPF